MTDLAPTDAVTPTALPAVLFVDDEPEVLDGLRTSLRRLRRQYSFHFAHDSTDAFAILDREPIDLMVTDIRMPGTNGVELLRQVKARHPDVLRYVLSGEAERELVVQAVPITHRWLTKPCGRDDLVHAIEDALRHRRLLTDPAIVSAVARADALPGPPMLYAELQELLINRDVSVDDLARLVNSDPAVSAKVLQWANSAFASAQPCSDLRGAIVRIGLTALSQIVLLAGVADLLQPAMAVGGIDAERYGLHIANMADIAAALAHSEDAPITRLGAVLSHAGLLFEAGYMPERLAASHDTALRSGRTLVEVERELHGVAHPDLGGHLLSMWGLPSELVILAVAGHQLPQHDLEPPLPPLEAIRAARLVAQHLPLASELGPAHLDQIPEPLTAAVDRWLLAVPSIPEDSP